MFFNAGRMGFKHFVAVAVPVDGPSGNTYCFGLTDTEHVVFGFDTFPVPDKPAFAYLYDCAMAAECFSYDGIDPYDGIEQCTNDGTPDPPPIPDPGLFCSCTGDHVRTLGCFVDNLISLGGPNADCRDIESGVDFQLCTAETTCSTPECCEEVDCRAFGHTSCKPTDAEFCDFCYGGTGEGVHCGITVPYTAPQCQCTTEECADDCPNVNCSTCTGILEYIGPANCAANPAREGVIPQEFATEFSNGHYCMTNTQSGGTEFTVHISEFAPNITSTSEISPGRMINITGNDCASCSSSSYKAFFAYLSYGSGGETLCNLFMTPTISGPCNPPGFLEDGCTFSLPGYTFEQQSSPNRLFPEGLYQGGFGCGAGLVRQLKTSSMDYSRRIDSSFIDTCGVNPCNCSDSTQTESTAGFTGGSCRSFPERFQPPSTGTAREHYEYFYQPCDNVAPGSTGMFVVNTGNDETSRTPRVREAVNRIGIRSEELFDLPITSTGVARSFFAPWVDNSIDRLTIEASQQSDDLNGDTGIPSVYPNMNYHSWFTGPLFDKVLPNSLDFNAGDARTSVAIDPGDNFVSGAPSGENLHGQESPYVFGNFVVPPGFFGYVKDAKDNITQRGYFNSWGPVKLNEFSRQDSVWTGGTLPSFGEVLTNLKEAPPAIVPGGANEAADHLKSNPMGLTGICGMGWCSMVGRQNSSWLNPRFTVLSNWLWIGAGNSSDWKSGDAGYAGSTYWSDSQISTIVDKNYKFQSAFVVGGGKRNMYGGLFTPHSKVFLSNARNNLENIDVSQNYTSSSPDNTTSSGTQKLPQHQYPCQYRSINIRPEYEVDSSNIELVHDPVSDLCIETSNPHAKFALYRNAEKSFEPNQRFAGMDRWNLYRTLGNSGGGLGTTVVDGIIPSPSLLSYYPFNVVGGYLYAGPDTDNLYGAPLVSLDELNEVTGIGNANGFLYGGFGRDIMWMDRARDQTVYYNGDGTVATGATSPWRDETDQHSAGHAQRLFANGPNTSSTVSAHILDPDTGVPDHTPGGRGGERFSLISNCTYFGWRNLTASHCLLDIEALGGIRAISSKFAGCTAHYNAPAVGEFPSAGGSTANSTYQFNGNGWWYRSHEQLRKGINECGWTCGIGPHGWVKHEHGWYPNYDSSDTTEGGVGDQRYGAASNSEYNNSNADGYSRTFTDSYGDSATPLTKANWGTNAHINNGWTACAVRTQSNYQKSVRPQTFSGSDYGPSPHGHFPGIAPNVIGTGVAAAYYPVEQNSFVWTFDDTLVFDAVFAWVAGNSFGFGSGGGSNGLETGGYFTLVAQDGDTLQIRVTGGTNSCTPGSTYSEPVNLNIRPYDTSLDTYGYTFDLICATDDDINKPHLGACARITDKTLGGFDTRVFDAQLNNASSAANAIDFTGVTGA